NVTRAARMFAALEFALKSTIDPNDPNATLWDSTVVVATSEFGRESGVYSPSDTTGGGSAHGPWSGWPVFGGPVATAGQGGKLLTDSKNDGFFHQNSVLTAVLRGMGVEEANSPYLKFADFPPIQGLFKGT